MMRAILMAIVVAFGTFYQVARASSFVIAVPASLSPAASDQATTLFGGLYERLRPGDQMVVVDASHLTRVATINVPANLGDGKKARARAFGADYGAINAFLAGTDSKSATDNLNIPRLLREIGFDILPAMRDHKAQVLLVGSIIWENAQDGDFTFRDMTPSDGFLTTPGDTFSVIGQETALSGALVSICFTDKLSDFQWDGFRDQIVNFWGKSIVGRGGAVGSIQPAAGNCLDRLLDATPSTQSFVIDRTERLFLRKVHLTPVEVQ